MRVYKINKANDSYNCPLARQIIGHLFHTMQGHRIHFIVEEFFNLNDGLGVIPIRRIFRIEPSDFIKMRQYPF